MTVPWGGVAKAAIKLAIDGVENKRPTDDVATQYVHTAIETVQEAVVDKHLATVLSLRKRYPLQNIDVLSSNIARNANIPHAVRQQVGLFQQKLRAVIQRVALTIEEQEYKTCDEALACMDLSYIEQKKVKEFTDADKTIHISFQSINVAAQIFKGLNDFILKRVTECQEQGNAKRERDFVLANAILVYELNDFLINFIENFEIDGLDQLSNIEKEMKSTLASLRGEQESLQKRAVGENIIDDSIRKQILQNVTNRLKAIETIELEWDKYSNGISSMKAGVFLTRKELHTLKLVRDDARSQINMLEVAAMVQFVTSNIDALKSAITTIKGIELIPPSSDMVLRMLNIEKRAD